MSKDMLYFNLLEVMDGDSCPICRMVDRHTRLAMDGFLYECVNDTALRQEITAGRGFCPTHSRMLEQMGDPLAHALIYGDLLEKALRDIKRQRLEPYARPGSCLFCRKAAETEQAYGAAFAAGFRDEAFRDAYREKGLLCLRHLSLTAPLDSSGRILADTAEKYRRLQEQLAEIRRKNDYRFKEEPWTPGAADSWRRCVDIFAGVGK